MASPYDFSDLKAVFLNCSLKRSSEPSHTQLLMDDSIAIMRAQGVQVDCLRVADLDIPHGVQPDMRDYGYDTDDWPTVQQQVFDANSARKIGVEVSGGRHSVSFIR